MSLPMRKVLPPLLTVAALVALVAATLYLGALAPGNPSVAPPVSQVPSFDPYAAPPTMEADEAKQAEQGPAPEEPAEAAKVLANEPSPADLLRAQINELRTGAGPNGKRTTLKPAIFRVVTNFSKADIRVNGLSYKEFYTEDEQEGMVLPAGGPYTVVTEYDGKVKTSTLSFRPYETHYMVVELTGYNAPPSAAPAPPTPAVVPPRDANPEVEGDKEEDEGKAPGKITVYSKPRGTVIIDGKDTGTAAPNTVEAEDGRHEVQVKYEGGEVSEKKIVRVRKGSKIKLFFRQRTDDK